MFVEKGSKMMKFCLKVSIIFFLLSIFNVQSAGRAQRVKKRRGEHSAAGSTSLSSFSSTTLSTGSGASSSLSSSSSTSTSSSSSTSLSGSKIETKEVSKKTPFLSDSELSQKFYSLGYAIMKKNEKSSEKKDKEESSDDKEFMEFLQENFFKFYSNKSEAVNIQTQNGFTMLHQAIYEDDPEVFKFLLENGADPLMCWVDSKPRMYGGVSPLCMAIEKGRITILKILIQANKNVLLAEGPGNIFGYLEMFKKAACCDGNKEKEKNEKKYEDMLALLMNALA